MQYIPNDEAQRLCRAIKYRLRFSKHSDHVRFFVQLLKQLANNTKKDNMVSMNSDSRLLSVKEYESLMKEQETDTT